MYDKTQATLEEYQKVIKMEKKKKLIQKREYKYLRFKIEWKTDKTNTHTKINSEYDEHSWFLGKVTIIYRELKGIYFVYYVLIETMRQTRVLNVKPFFLSNFLV